MSTRTAMSRGGRPSAPLLKFIETCPVGGPILDYGCGLGEDVEHLSTLAGLGLVDGYDPGERTPERFRELPKRLYGTVLMTYVLNVIEDPGERLWTIREAWSRVRNGGNLVIACRSASDIQQHAKRSGWTPRGEGYTTKKFTFQMSLDHRRLLWHFETAAVQNPSYSILNNDAKFLQISFKRDD